MGSTFILPPGQNTDTWFGTGNSYFQAHEVEVYAVRAPRASAAAVAVTTHIAAAVPPEGPSLSSCPELAAWLAEADAINPRLALMQQLRPLYKASRDGWEAKEFHARCDNQGATLSLVRTVGGQVFGGFADQPWGKEEEEQEEEENGPRGHKPFSGRAFLFSLRCHTLGIPVLRMKLSGRADSQATQGGQALGLAFGAGDLIIPAKGANTGANCTVSLGAGSYELPQGLTADFLVGGGTFQAAEIEVWAVPARDGFFREPWETVTFNDFPLGIKKALETEQAALILKAYSVFFQTCFNRFSSLA